MMSRVMNKELTLASQIEEWTREAVALFGGDWKKIAAYLQDRFAELDEIERARFTTEAWSTLLGPIGRQSDTSTH
jgi:hypothetical protein